MSIRASKKVTKKIKRKAEFPTFDPDSRSSTPDSLGSENSSLSSLPAAPTPVLVDQSEPISASSRPKSALDKVIDELDYDSFVVFANVKNRRPGMRASFSSDNAGRLRLCINGISCPRKDDDCPFTHVKFDQRDTWNPEEDELFTEVAYAAASMNPPSPDSPARLLSSPSPIPVPVSLPPPLLASSSASGVSNSHFPSYAGSYSNFSYPARPPYSPGFLVGQPSYPQGGGFTSSGLYTGPAQSPMRSQWVQSVPPSLEDDKDLGRPPAHLMARELAKLSVREKRKVKNKTQKRISPSAVPSHGLSPPSQLQQRWSITRPPPSPVDLSLGTPLGRQFEMQSNILVQV